MVRMVNFFRSASFQISQDRLRYRLSLPERGLLTNVTWAVDFGITTKQFTYIGMNVELAVVDLLNEKDCLRVPLKAVPLSDLTRGYPK